MQAPEPLSTDRSQARQRLLLAALQLFAEHGYAKTSTRDIAQAAGTNIAQIRYYFGDKEGLYRAAFMEPVGSPKDDIPRYLPEHLTLAESLHEFYAAFLEPLKQGDLVQQCMRLHFREMVDPTGLWAQELEQGIKPAHAALVQVLCRHLGLAEADDEVHALALSITSLALQMYICKDVIASVRPQLQESPAAIDAAVRRLAGFAQALVAAEATRRSAATP